jgi:hypothetical protein
MMSSSFQDSVIHHFERWSGRATIEGIRSREPGGGRQWIWPQNSKKIYDSEMCYPDDAPLTFRDTGARHAAPRRLRRRWRAWVFVALLGLE